MFHDNWKNIGTRRRKEIKDRYKKIHHSDLHPCTYCATLMDARDPVQYTVDHIVPRSLNGANSLENLKPCCRTCNEEKADLTIEEWLNILNRQFEDSGANDARLLYKIMRVMEVKQYADTMGNRLYKYGIKQLYPEPEN